MSVSGETADSDQLVRMARLVRKGERIGNVEELYFRDPDSFVAGELHKRQT